MYCSQLWTVAIVGIEIMTVYLSLQRSKEREDKLDPKKVPELRKGDTTCPICSRDFPFPKDLERHHRCFHTGNSKYRYKYRSRLYAQLPPSQSQLYLIPTMCCRCEPCDRIFQDMRGLSMHMARCPNKSDDSDDNIAPTWTCKVKACKGATFSTKQVLQV